MQPFIQDGVRRQTLVPRVSTGTTAASVASTAPGTGSGPVAAPTAPAREMKVTNPKQQLWSGFCSMVGVAWN
jgi:hypothetical protein